MTRLEQLLQYLEQDPHDPFNLYAVALEYQKSDMMKAWELFNRLLTEHAEYVPTYYHAGKLLADMEETEHAREIFRRGIVVAEKAGDSKAARELRNAYGEIEYD